MSASADDEARAAAALVWLRGTRDVSRVLSTECAADIRAVLGTRERLGGSAIDLALWKIASAVDDYRWSQAHSSTEQRDEAHRQRKHRQRWLEELIDHADALGNHCDLMTHLGFSSSGDTDVSEIRSFTRLLRDRLPELTAHARTALARYRIPRGRPFNTARASLEYEVALALHEQGARLTTASDGTLGRVLNLIYAEIGVGEDARDPRTALKRACSLVPPWIQSRRSQPE